MALQDDLKQENGVRLLEHLRRITATQGLRDAHESLGKRPFADVVEEANVVIENDGCGWKRLEKRMHKVCVAFEGFPVSDIVLPVSCKEDRRQQIRAGRMLVAQMWNPLS